MATSSSKRQRLRDDTAFASRVASSLKLTSMRQLREILNILKDDDDERNVSLRGLRGLQDDVRKRVMGIIVLDMEGGKTWDWPIADHAKALQLAVNASEELRGLYEERLQQTPCSATQPWRLIVAFDELSPGAQLIGRHDRKVLHVCYTFLELGRQARHTDNVWISVACHSAWLV